MSSCKSLCTSFRPENLPAAIAVLRGDGHIPAIAHISDGGQCRIFKADFTSGESWSIRVPIHTQACESAILRSLEDEYDMLQYLAEAFAWSPKCHASSITFQNPTGFPWIALSWIEGSPLQWTSDYPPRAARDHVMGQIAKIHVSLVDQTQEPRGPASSYFSRLVENKVHRVRNGQLPELTEEDCVTQKAMLPKMLIPELENAPFAVDHGDFAPLNIIVDPDWNITGIIDWGFASKVPMQMAGRMPRIIQPSDPSTPPQPHLQRDRMAYVTCLRSLHSQAASWLLMIHSVENADFHECFLESLISKGMHRRLVDVGWEMFTKENGMQRA